MLLNLNKDSILTFDVTTKNKKFNLKMKLKNKYINYEVNTKIKYENIVTIIENIENMLFSEYKNVTSIGLNNVIFEFNKCVTKIKVSVKIFDNQDYVVELDRKNVINLYNYLTRYIHTLNKIKMLNMNKKYIYVEVRYIDVCSSRSYSYISEDKNIKVGDIVYVDMAGTKCLAVVKTKNEYYYEEAPFPVLQTKRVIKVVTRADNYIN